MSLSHAARWSVRPDWSNSSPWRHTWQGLANVDQFRWLVRRDMQQQLRLARQELGLRHVRAVGMFDDEMRILTTDLTNYASADRRHKPTTCWQVLDYVLDSLIELGIEPVFQTNFMPSSMADGQRTVFNTKSRISPPKDHRAWGELIEQCLRHTVERYGLARVRGWYFEPWNEPNLTNGFFEGTQEQYFHLWETAYRAIKNVDGDLRVGGPSSARGQWIEEMVRWARSHDCLPDFLVTHIYNNDSESAPLCPFDGLQADRQSHSPHFASGVIRGVAQLLESLNYPGELHWNEWGRSWLPHDPRRESPNEAAFIAKTMTEVSQTADAFAYWCLSDIYDQAGYGNSEFHGNYGMLSQHGLRKPAYHAHQLLNLTGRRRHPIAEQPATGNRGALATSGERLAVLLYDFDPDQPDTAMSFDVQIALPAQAKSKRFLVYRIDSTHHHILKAWKEMGSPAHLRMDQVASLQFQNALTPQANRLRPTLMPDGTLAIRLSMETSSVLLLLEESGVQD